MTDKYPELEQYKTLRIPIEVIHFDREFNCRGVFTPQSCVELSESIRLHGLKIPIIVQPWSGPEFRIITGHRRFTAAKYLLHWSTIPATVVSGLTEQEARMLNLLENLERKDLSLMQEARALRKTYPKGASLAQIGRDLNKSSFWVRIRWKLMDAPEAVQERVERGVLTAIDLANLLSKSPKEQAVLAAQCELEKARGVSSKKFFKMSARRAKNRTQIQEMLTRLHMEGTIPNGYDALSWAAGFLTDEELLDEQV